MSEESIRMKDVIWSEQMKINFEQIVRFIPVPAGTFGNAELLKNIEENARKRGALNVSEQDLVNAILDHIPVYYHEDLTKILGNIGIFKNQNFYQKRNIKKIYMDILLASEIAETNCDKNVIMKFLNTYQKIFLDDSIEIVMSTTTKKTWNRELEVRFSGNDHWDNLLQTAINQELFVPGGHAIEYLYNEISMNFSVESYGMEFSAIWGFQKIEMSFPASQPQSMLKLLELSHIPKSINGSCMFFKKFHLLTVNRFLVDFFNKSISLSININQTHDFSRKMMEEMLLYLGYVIPKKELLILCEKAKTVIITCNWVVPEISKIGFEVSCPTINDIPRNLNPKIEKYINKAPFGSVKRSYFYVLYFTKKNQYMKIENIYLNANKNI